MLAPAPAIAERFEDLDSESDANATLELLGVSLEDVAAELDFRQRQKEAQMHQEMAAAAKAGGERRIFKIDGVGGEVQFMVHPVSWHYWGGRLGYRCWQDAGFIREYLRDNPAARVKSRAINPTLRVQGFKKPGAAFGAKSPARRGPVSGVRGRWAL
jgi:hypothetical protein